jgi:predicted metal-dependent enzyme (double-stranded beta helix superfamily)
MPGHETIIHDHISWCVSGVYKGTESETQYDLRKAGSTSYLVARQELTHKKGAVSGITPPGDIHRVRNLGSETAVSIHIYGADIAKAGTSIRRKYHLPVSE